MKKILTLLLVLTGLVFLSGCTEPKETEENPCGDTMVLIDDTCIAKESFCKDTQAYVDGECKEIECPQGEVVIDRTCQVPPPTCSATEELIDGVCVPVEEEVDCEVSPFHVDCITEPTCTDEQVLVDGKCEDKNTQVDCEVYPFHVDCIDPVEECDLGYELVGGECVLISDEDKNFLDIYYLNDFHGAIINDGNEIGMARIANLILTQKAVNPDNTLFVTGGDILQGSALSNYFEGESTIELLDLAMLDAFILGNHEFDWGLDVVTQYFDEIEENGEADFPLLAANVFYKGTETRPDHIDPYTIVEKGDIKIGIIGAIGANLESSIATSRIEDYEFVYALPYIEEYATYLRGTENCDVVIVVAHDTGSINNAVAELTGLAKIDAVFNGHSHQEYVEGSTIPFVQSGGNGRYVGHVRLNFDENGDVESYYAENLDIYDDILLQTPHSDVQALIDQYIEETTALFDNPIITPGEYLSSSDLSTWIARLMKEATGSDIGFQNYGGTRRSVGSDEILTVSVLYEVWPFDNQIKTVWLPGSVVKDLLSSGNAYYTDITTFDDNTLYKVATNDYIFDKTNNPFLGGQDIEITGLLLRDLAIDELMLQASIYDYFYFSNDIQTIYYE